MNQIDLKGRPFYLDEADIKWVETTKQQMSIEEKIGQLFFMIGMSTKEKELIQVVERIKPGGMMYRPSKAKVVTKSHRVLQSTSKVPMLLAANLEAGGNGLIDEGTAFGNQMMVAATDNVDHAYNLGDIACKEAASVGGNMAFAPIIDINMNFRNPITNTRSFGDDPSRVAKMGAAYVKAAHDNNMCVTIKHFPGDGVDGRDQHLVTTYNSLSYNEWMATFGLAYKTSIDAGARGLMVGHIALPKYMEEVHPSQKDFVKKPATLNPYLLNDLLRKELGYNGLTMTDASLMTGFGQHGKRSEIVPGSIAAGCDMFLFTRMPEDDYDHMMKGYEKGIITDARLDEALTRILAMKASLGLHKKSLEELVPGTFESLNKTAHQVMSDQAADEAVTLVKDDQGILPMNPQKHKRIGVIFNGNIGGMEAILGNIPGFKGFMLKTLMRLSNIGKPNLSEVEKFIDALKVQGFDAFEYSFGDLLAIMKEMNSKTLKEWASQFDAIIVLAKWETMSNQTSLQVNYKAAGFDAPWWVEDVPTILVSVGNPYHQYDLEMIKTVINGYMPSESVYKAVAEKIAGKSPFKGKSPVELKFDEVNASNRYIRD